MLPCRTHLQCHLRFQLIRTSLSTVHPNLLETAQCRYHLISLLYHSLFRLLVERKMTITTYHLQHDRLHNYHTPSYPNSLTSLAHSTLQVFNLTRETPSPYFSCSGSTDACDFQRYGSMMLSPIFQQRTGDTCMMTVWRQTSFPMTLEDPGDRVQSFVGTR